MIHISVPATTANLGVGFDTLGMALTMRANFYVSYHEELDISGCQKEFQSEDNLVYQSYKKAMNQLNYPIKPLKLRIDSPIPHARGLGSSATCVVAGILAAYALTNTPINQQNILALSTEIEGHPDNVAPAILGGLIASTSVDGYVHYQEYPVHPSYTFVALSPDFTLSTELARKSLPDTLSFKDVVAQQSRLLFSLKALETGDSSLLSLMLKDILHEPYRGPLIHDYDALGDILREQGAVSHVISGSGPTVLALFKEEVPEPFLTDKSIELSYNWSCTVLDIDTKGAIIC